MTTVGWCPAGGHWPDRIVVGTTTRTGGVSAGGCATLNLAAHVDDLPTAVADNRRRLVASLDLPAEPLWLEQVHGTAVFRDDGRSLPRGPYDAAVTTHPGRVLAVLTADCLPVVFVGAAGARRGIAHAGWRGLAAGVLEATLEALEVPGSALTVWIGPAIGPAAFETGDDVRDAFVAGHPADAGAFVRNSRGRWQGDLVALARARLRRLGVLDVRCSGACTFADAERFYSHRRDAASGRQATLVFQRLPG